MFTRARLVVLAAVIISTAAAITACQLPSGQAPTPPPQIAFPGQYAPPPADWKYPVWPKGCARFGEAERLRCLDFVAADFGRLSRYAAANAALAPRRPGEIRVVFFGDSVIDNWSRSTSGGFFPGRAYVNRGIGGQTTAQMLVRFRADVVSLDPAAVVILAGTNDVAGNAGEVAVESIQDNFATMAELASTHGICVVLASLLPISDDERDATGVAIRRSKDRPPGILRGLNRWLADYASRSGHVYLDLASALAQSDGSLRGELTDDGLHPNRAGYAVMAPLAEQAIEEALSSAGPPVIKRDSTRSDGAKTNRSGPRCAAARRLAARRAYR